MSAIQSTAVESVFGRKFMKNFKVLSSKPDAGEDDYNLLVQQRIISH